MVKEETLVKLRHEDPARRRKALESLAKDGHPDNLACLIEALSDQVDSVRKHARKLLEKLTRRDLGSSREEWTKWWKENAGRACQTCGIRLYDHELYYRVKVDITSEPREVIISEDDLKEDIQAKIAELCEEMKNRSPEEIEEEVWVRLEYFLCTNCKKEFVRKTRSTPFET